MTTLNRPCLSSRNEPRNIAVARSRETLGMWLVMSIWKWLSVVGTDTVITGTRLPKIDPERDDCRDQQQGEGHIDAPLQRSLFLGRRLHDGRRLYLSHRDLFLDSLKRQAIDLLGIGRGSQQTDYDQSSHTDNEHQDSEM